jgi:hypothetical protein
VGAAVPGIWSVAKRHNQAFGAALDLELPKAPRDSTFLYLFERVELEELFRLLRDWMLAQIADQDKDIDQLICDSKTLRGSAAQLDGVGGATRFVTLVTLYARDLGVAIAQTSFDTCPASSPFADDWRQSSWCARLPNRRRGDIRSEVDGYEGLIHTGKGTSCHSGRG